MKKVLIFYDYFDPAYKAGGPIRSLVNLVALMDEEISIHILTTNQDHDKSILSVEPDRWIQYRNFAKVMYLSKLNRGYATIKKVISEVDPETVYLNGMYSLSFMIFPLWRLRKLNHVKVVIAPRGMLQQESLAIKPVKKKIYLSILKKLLLRRDVYWHVTTAQEKLHLQSFISDAKFIRVIGNVPNYQINVEPDAKTLPDTKVFGTVALISPMKNIHLILDSLANITFALTYKLYGPIKDQKYWNACLHSIKNLPPSIKFIYGGEIKPDSVSEVISSFDFYIQPSKSENFGHSIFEAFNHGIPVIISDQTPWKSLQKKRAGWDVDLKDSQSLENAISDAAQLDRNSYLEYCKGSRKIAVDYMESHDFVLEYSSLL